MEGVRRLRPNSGREQSARLKSARLSPLEKWLRQFYGRLEKCVLSAGKSHVHKIPRFGGGGVFWVYGRADFSENNHCQFLTPTRHLSVTKTP